MREVISRTISHLDNRPILHLCDAVDAVALGLGHWPHGQSKEGALKKNINASFVNQMENADNRYCRDGLRKKYQEAESSNDPVCPLPVGYIQQFGHHRSKDNRSKTGTTC